MYAGVLTTRSSLQCSITTPAIDLPEYTAQDENATWTLHNREWGPGTAAGPLVCSCHVDDEAMRVVCVLDVRRC